MNKADQDELAQGLARRGIEACIARNEGEEVEEWMPVMSPSQRDFFWDDRPYILAHGERLSGKTMVALHKLVAHCVENDDALAMIVTITKATATGGGVWDDLTNEADFMEGPLAGTPAGILAMWREGIDLEYGEPYEDGAHNKYIDIRNKHGGVSRIMLKSMPISSQIQHRVKGQHPSFFLFEELTNTFDPDYFTKVIQQLYRRKTVKTANQQYVATCNPANEGKNHWVYKTFFEPKKGQSMKDHEKKFGVHHVKMSENDWIPNKQEYIEAILEDCAFDITAADRMIRGEWVERLVGQGLFEGFWLPEIHIKPSPGSRGYKKGHGLLPFTTELFTIGYDPGAVNNAKAFLQRSWIDGRWRWRIIDELIDFNKRYTDHQLVKMTMDKMLFWNKRMDCLFPWEHISDEQAKTHWNPSGSYIYREWAKISKDMIDKGDRYNDLVPIRMKCPKKGAGSKEERVKCLINKLANEEIWVSARCRGIIEMFGFLRRDKDKFGNDEMFIPARTRHIHTFDCVSYPIYYYDLQTQKNPAQSLEGKVKPRITMF